MRIIERPMSKSYVDDAIFHYCQNKEEAENAFRGVAPEDIITWGRTVNMETFQPLLAVMVREKDKPIKDWYKYIVPMELYTEVDELNTRKEL
jgi:hypothetical protein